MAFGGVNRMIVLFLSGGPRAQELQPMMSKTAACFCYRRKLKSEEFQIYIQITDFIHLYVISNFVESKALRPVC